MTLSDPGALDEYRKRLEKAKVELEKADHYFKGLTNKEKNMTKRTILILLSEYSVLMRDLYSQIEILAIANASLKSQIDVLHKILVQLPDVKNNRQLRDNIEELFSQHNLSF
jgi:hypothetical protein